MEFCGGKVLVSKFLGKKIIQTYRIYFTTCEIATLIGLQCINFMFQINVSQDELKREREKVITHLISPLSTILDDSLGCALWFASRGRGLLNGSNEIYTSPARVSSNQLKYIK